jgi:hypothetical protein
MEILDSKLVSIPKGNANALDFPPPSRDRTRFLRFTLTLNPRLTNPGVLDIDPSEFPSPTATTVYVRAITENGTLRAEINKEMTENNPKVILAFYEQEQVEFDILVKSRYDTAPNPEKYEVWLRDIAAKAKFYACKQYIQKFYVGTLEGTETLAQRIVSLKQHYYNPETQKHRGATTARYRN